MEREDHQGVQKLVFPLVNPREIAVEQGFHSWARPSTHVCSLTGRETSGESWQAGCCDAMQEMAAVIHELMTNAPITTRKTILVVDDEPGVLDLVKTILQRQGYRVLTASSGPKALDTCERHGAVDLLLTDVMMPEMSGFELVRGMRDLHPDLPVLYMTGGMIGGFATDEVDSRCNLLKKPFNSRTLLRTVEDVLEARSAS